MDRWTDGKMDGWTDGGMDGWTDGQTDGWSDGRMAGWKDGLMDNRVNSVQLRDQPESRKNLNLDNFSLISSNLGLDNHEICGLG